MMWTRSGGFAPDELPAPLAFESTRTLLADWRARSMPAQSHGDTFPSQATSAQDTD